jgi:hypothetical protein
VPVPVTAAVTSHSAYRFDDTRPRSASIPPVRAGRLFHVSDVSDQVLPAG